MDESGDLWFDFSKDKTSRYFVVSFLLVHDIRKWNKLVKNIISKKVKKHKKKNNWVLHFHKEQPVTRRRLLKDLSKLDVSVMALRLDKTKVYTHLHNEKHVLYNYVTNILLDRIVSKNLLPKDDLHLIVAKRETNKFLNDNFSNYLTKSILNKHNINIDIQIESYHQSKNKCLQLVDAVSWSIFRKREHGDDSYYQLMKDIVIEESKLFW